MPSLLNIVVDYSDPVTQFIDPKTDVNILIPSVEPWTGYPQRQTVLGKRYGVLVSNQQSLLCCHLEYQEWRNLRLNRLYLIFFGFFRQRECRWEIGCFGSWQRPYIYCCLRQGWTLLWWLLRDGGDKLNRDGSKFICRLSKIMSFLIWQYMEQQCRQRGTRLFPWEGTAARVSGKWNDRNESEERENAGHWMCFRKKY